MNISNLNLMEVSNMKKVNLITILEAIGYDRPNAVKTKRLNELKDKGILSIGDAASTVMVDTKIARMVLELISEMKSNNNKKQGAIEMLENESYLDYTDETVPKTKMTNSLLKSKATSTKAELEKVKIELDNALIENAFLKEKIAQLESMMGGMTPDYDISIDDLEDYEIY